MRRMNAYRAVTAVAMLAAATLQPRAVAAAPLIINGSFESGFSSWTRVNQVGSEGNFFLQTGIASPVNGLAVPPPPGGVNAAMTDAEGSGSHVLYQDFLVPLGTLSGSLTFDLFINNLAGAFTTPNTLDFATPALNQRARVDILRAGTDPFSVAPADLLLNVFQTAVGSPLVSGYTSITANVSALLAGNAGGALRLRFAEVDNVNIFNFGVDRVNLDASATAVPEPTTLGLLGLGLAGVLARRRSREERWRERSR